MWEEIDKMKGPIYRQMMDDQIMKNIENGNLAPGERLPSEEIGGYFYDESDNSGTCVG